jgi:hypothetical protein
MTQGQGNESLEKFEYSEAALAEYYAGTRRNVRPGLVFLTSMFVAFSLKEFGVPMAVTLPLFGVGMIISVVMVVQN